MKLILIHHPDVIGELMLLYCAKHWRKALRQFILNKTKRRVVDGIGHYCRWCQGWDDSKYGLKYED